MKKYTPEQLDQIFLQIKEFVTCPEYKLRIIDLRKFIDEIYPREADTSKEDFAEIKKSFVGLNKRVKHIEMCLGIDFKLDEILEPVKYDFIKDDFIRDSAYAYYREMLRYQFGTRNHKICFGEFCRFATIQIEFLLNYFFTSEKHLELIREELEKIANNQYEKAYNSWKEKSEDYEVEPEPIKMNFENEVFANKEKYIPEISLGKKCKIFYDTFLNKVKIGNNFISFVSNWTANMRNRKSHGSKTTIEPYEENYLTDSEMVIFEEWRSNVKALVDQYNKKHDKKIKFDNNRLFPYEGDWSRVPENIKTTYNKNKDLQWVFRKPFDEVLKLLQIVASTCAKNL